MADSISLSALRKTKLSSEIATQQWTDENFLPLSAQVRQAWYGECHTAQATKAKTVEIPGITELQTGLQVKIKFKAAQRATSPTLNINGLGAHPIIRSGTTAVVNYEWLANEVIDLVFDGTNWIVSDGGVASTSYYGYTKLYNGATSTSTSLALAPAALNSYSENTVVGAPALLTSSTYSVGDRVRYQFNTYECISDVQTPGAWASISSHFKELDPIQIQIDNLSNAIVDIDIPEVPTDLSAFTNSPGYITDKSLSALSNYIPLSGNAIVANPFVLSTRDADVGLKQIINIYSNEWGEKIAIGPDAYATGTQSIQLGAGTNGDSYTFKVWNTTILGANGKIPPNIISNLPISSVTNLQTTLNNKLSGVKMNGSNVTVTNGVADLSTVLTAHQSLSDLYVLSGEVVEGLSNVVIPKLDTISGLVEDEVEKVDEISAKFDDYSLTGHTHTSSDITNFPPIPTNTNQLVNGAGFITSSQVDTKIAALDGAITGSAGAGKTLTSFSQTDGKVTAGFGDISITKSQISDFPTIPTVNNGTLTIQRNGSTVQTFTANQSTAVSANIIVPTKTSDLTNDSGYVVSSDLTKVMEYQGSVTNFSDLPNNAKKGAVYDVISAYNDNPPGTNYAWSGTSWDPLGGSIDVSKFATKTQLEDYLPLSGGSIAGALSANNGFHADGYSGTTGLSIGNGENDEYYTHLIATTIKTQQSGGGVVFENGYGYGLSVDAGFASNFYGAYLNATKVKSEELFVNADIYEGGGLSVGQGTDDIYGTYINATNLTAPGMIAGINTTAPHGGLSVTGIDFGDGSYLSSANGFALASALNKLSSEVVNGLSVEINPKLRVIADAVEEEVAKLDELSGKLSGYALTSDIPLSVSQLINDKGYITSSYVSLSTVEQNYVFVLTEEQKTALVQQSGMPAEAWGDFIVHINPNNNYGYIGNIDCYSVSQNANGDYVYTAGMPVIESALGWVPNNTIVQGSTVHNVLSVGNTSVDLALKSDLEKYLPLDGGGVITGALEIESINGHNMFAVRPYGTIKIGEGSNTDGTGAIAIGYNTSVDNWNSLAIGYGAYADKYGSIAIGHEAEVSAQYSIQLGHPASHGGAGSILTTDNTFRVWEYPMLDGNGDIPYARLSSAIGPILGNILSTLQTINGTANS